MTIWLKVVGAVDDPMPDPWLILRGDLRHEMGFHKKANVEIGDELVLYAIPQRKVIGIAKVNSPPAWSGKHPRWPWRSTSTLELAIADADRAPSLEDIEEPGGRNLSESVQRESQIELRRGEYARARAALEQACDPARGDVRRGPLGGGST
jgi:hypothetical protein